MPSASLQRWQTDRLPSLAEIDTQCAASLALFRPSPSLIDENLRGCVLVPSAHFQGFCRAFYSECTMIVVTKVRPALQVLIQTQSGAHPKLDHGNSNAQNSEEDFERFNFTLDLGAADPENPAPETGHRGAASQLRDWRWHWPGLARPGRRPVRGPLDGRRRYPVRMKRRTCHGLAGTKQWRPEREPT